MSTSHFLSLEELAADDPLGRAPAEFERYCGPRLVPDMVRAAEKSLGVTLPASLIELLRESNGGFLRKRAFRIGDDLATWDMVHGIGHEQGLDGLFGSYYMSEEWGYPEGLLWIGGDGHSGIFLDYRTCGAQGEPSVVWFDTESDEPEPQPIASTFTEFLGRLE